MRKLMKFVPIAILTVIISFSVWTAEEEAAIDTSKLPVITVLAWDRGAVPADQGTIESNWWTKYVNQKVAKLGFQVKWIPVPRAQEAQKLPTMFAAGDAPDVVFSYDKPLFGLLVKNGALLDYTDYLVKYGDNIRKAYTQAQIDVGKMNGRQYSFVYHTVPTHDTTWIRKDWLDKLGIKAPTTPDEFYAMLKAFKDKDPGGVGDKLVPFAFSGSPNYPFGIWFSVVLPAFLKEAPKPDRLFEAVVPMWPETKDCMRFLNKLYNEKLLGEFTTDKNEELLRQKFVRGEIGALVNFAHWAYHSAYGNMFDNLQKNVPSAWVMPIFPWSNASGQNFYGIVRNQPYGYMYFSPAYTKHPDLVMKYLDWLSSDEAVMAGWNGLEGQDYKMTNGVPVPIDTEAYKKRVPWIGSQYNTFRNPYIASPDRFLRRQALDFSEKYRDQHVKLTLAGSDKVRYAAPWITVPTPNADKLTLVLSKKWIESQAKIITAAPGQFDAIFDEAVKAYRAEGGDDVAKELSAAYQTQYGK
ncbi:MAG: extracellular solute-binding protein [Spirochaetaceae bacterium]|nr:MAG: extracellular solute-binding protein [Spirochaetaceae bacterium]